jgi:hypothetical protein
MASSRSHITTLSIRHVGIADKRKLTKYKFGVVSNGTLSVPNFVKIRLAIIYLLNAHKPISGWSSDAHAQMNLWKSVIIVPPHDFKHPSLQKFQL